MSQPIDLTGERFGRWRVIRRDGTMYRRTAWLCVCDCGDRKRVPSQRLTSGNSKGCRQCLLDDSNPTKITVSSRTMTITQWSKETGIPRRTINRRLKAGMSPKEAVKPVPKAQIIPSRNVHPSTRRLRKAFRKSRLTYEDVAKRLGCSRQSAWTGLNRTKKMHKETLKQYAAACRSPAPPRAYKTEDLSGQRFGRWTVVRRDRTKGQATWLCVCDCGRKGKVDTHRLNTGHMTGCSKCRASDRKRTQLTVGNRTMNVSQWSKKIGISASTIYQRLKDGLSPTEAVMRRISIAKTTPDGEVHLSTRRLRRVFRKSKLKYEELAERLGCSRQSVWNTLNLTKKLYPATLEQYAEALDVDIAEIIDP